MFCRFNWQLNMLKLDNRLIYCRFNYRSNKLYLKALSYTFVLARGLLLAKDSLLVATDGKQ